MAQIVLGIGCAHTPQLHTLAKDWDLRADRDRADGIPLWFKGRKLKYAELEAERAGERLVEKLDQPTRQAALDASFAAIDKLHDIFVEANPDVVVILGNDQHEIFSEIVPAFAIIATDQLTNVPRTEEQNARLPIGIEIADHGHLPDEAVAYPGQRALGLHLAHYLVREAGFDIALCHEKPTVRNDKSLLYGLPHAYGFLFKNVMRDEVKPTVPVDVNCWYFDNTPTARRCFDFGGAVADAIGAWESDARVAILTTGGLTHFVVDREWDEMFLDAMKRGDAETLSAIPQEELMAGTSECKSWIATAAAMVRAGLTMDVVGYQTLYRTEGGTGSSCAFVSWK
ncbi:protocatechuate 3,4-dioxygenase [Sphingomonas sp. So64.6b]|uniref:DODA-type extradiol aromatic ring-opening family dioxygenase n=1 Tax=Sphingomonas sp. So64.6b TaxID=2997354 RepID=UPI0015FFEA17|nr:protocatechuate 3,4-dioxygenase [Sphingomonas sp. So64.6b]QNA85509.1 protocatechuate 3,4-dioxygenase [Sphingomonas sp. So64.6b]